MLAVVTEVTVKLLPKPDAARAASWRASTTCAQAGDAVANVIAAGIIPAGLEMMDKPMTRAVEDFVHAGYDLDAAAILLCECDGTPEEVDDEIGRMLDVMDGARRDAHRRSAATRPSACGSGAGARTPFRRAGRISPDYMCMDSHDPAQAPGRHPARRSPRWSASTACAACNVFHAGDGNLHPLILFDANDPDELHRAELFGAEILETCVAAGRHDHRRARRRRREAELTCACSSRREERAQMFAREARVRPARAAQSRQGRCRRCTAAPSSASMHVQRGLLPFPELPRF